MSAQTMPARSDPETDYRSHDRDAIHHWFGLTYSSYLVVPRSVLQSMPREWQTEFVALLEECREALGQHCRNDHYTVQLRINNRFARDPLCDYERGRRVLELAADYRTARLVTPETPNDK